ncbi:glycosyltransferase [Candidatus Saccharibacteria bacterium]|nr:glycosyltransferase [Candidatus Saccharibacteria bacterium]
MTKRKDTPIDLFRKSAWTLRNEGVSSLTRKTKNYIALQTTKKGSGIAKDILFINGCGLPHPQRYRVDHQIEQLESCGLTVEKVFYENVDLSQIKFYRGFVFFRCPITDEIEEFIKKAHYFNKTCFFDIDDLVINTKYTNQIPFVAAMEKEDKENYDDGVIRMEKTLKLCDYLITSTPALARELKKNYDKEVLTNRNVASEMMAKLSFDAAKTVKKNPEKIVIGYLSGSITHNPDFELIKPALIKIMSEFENVYLEIMGILDVPEDFKPFEKRIIKKKFTDWKKLPEIIAGLDLNLAPLEETIFNEAKSENKWTEAALVKTPTLASNFGAFKDVIVDGETGLLAKTTKDWYEKLKFSIENPEKLHKIADNAHKKAISDYISTYSGRPLATFIEKHLAKNIGFVLPTTNISGGVNVVMKHCNILRNHGYDVSIISMAKPQENIKNSDGEINVISGVISTLESRFNTLVATLWTTLDFVKRYPDVEKKLYLVQNFETNFSERGNHSRIEANATYNAPFSDLEYITISKWCKKWLKEKFDKNASYVPNGLDLSRFKFSERRFDKNKKIKILVEGNSADYYKNVDESFKIVNKLDSDKFEINYLSYEGEPKSWYRVDKFYHKIPADEVHKVYKTCDILIKSSLLESFSYPPLEMMATGGFCVVAPNDGNAEYLADGENCLLYEQGNIDSAIEKINRLVDDKDLREHLEIGAKITVNSRDWKNLEEQILNLYD